MVNRDVRRWLPVDCGSRPSCGTEGRLWRSLLVAVAVLVTVLGMLCAPAVSPRYETLANGGTVTIPLCLQVTYQGHGPSGTSRWMLPVTTIIYAAGTSNIIAAWTQTTDGNGGYCTEISAPSSSILVDIQAKHSHTLSVKKTGVPLPGPASYIFLGTLLEGDANGNDQVSLNDFSILRTTYAQACPPCDGRADFNEDNYISILDFSLLRSNYARGGPAGERGTGPAGERGAGGTGSVISGVVQTTAAPAATGVTLTLSPATVMMLPGATAALDIVLQAGESPVDGVDVFLDVDPAYLYVSDADGAPAGAIIPGDKFSTVLLNSVDNSTGRINFSAGVLTGDPLTGTVTVARFYVTPLRQNAFGQTAITFSVQPPRRTEAAYIGESVLAGVKNTRVDILRSRLWLPVIVRNLAATAP